MYSILVRLYTTGIHLASLFNTKAGLWVKGRKNWRKRLASALQQKGIDKNSQVIWMHCASLGEFEQGRPVLEQLKKERPEWKWVLTFFSPSGYELRKNYTPADVVCYLPADSRKAAADFLELVQPGLAIFVKYDLWFHYIYRLQRLSIPIVLISARFRPTQYFFRRYGKPYLQLLRKFHQIFVQDEASKTLLEQYSFLNVQVAGDTRVDRVAGIAANTPEPALIKTFKGNSKILIAGSTWPNDETLLLEWLHHYLPAQWKCIMAPHQVDDAHVAKLEKAIRLPVVRYSRSDPKTVVDYRVLLIDNIGMLSSLYQYGDLAYIGGGFGKGIHNTLEPMAFGLPLIFGPRYQKFEEANYSVRCRSAISINDASQFVRAFEFYGDKAMCDAAKQAAENYIRQHKGATQKVVFFLLRTIVD